MREYRSRLATDILGCSALSICLLAVTVSTTLAQRGTPPPNVGQPPTIDPSGEMHDRQSRESMLRTVETDASLEKENQQRVAASIERVKQDFKRIQIIRNEMVDYLLADKPFDYKLISDQTGEINMRATRLKILVSSTIDAKEKSETAPVELSNKQMRGLLVKLCNKIYSFTKNPALRNPDKPDARQLSQAGDDLQSIIDISDSIKKSADSISKTPR